LKDPVAFRRLVRDVALVGTADGLKLLRVLVVLPLLSKSLGVEAYGVWSQLKVNSTFLGSLASLGMATAVLRFLSGEYRTTSVRDGFNSALGASVAGTLAFAAVLLTWPQLAASIMFGDAKFSVFVAATGLYLVLEVIDLLVMAYLRASRQMGFHLTAISIELVGEVAVVWAMVAGRKNLASVVFGIIGWKALVVLAKLARTWHQIGIAWPRASIIRGYLAFGIPLALSGLGYLIVNYGDRYFISYFMGIGPVGVYAAAYAVGSLTIVLCTPIDYVMYPAIAAEWNAGRRTEATRQIEMMLQWLIYLLVPILAGLAVLARPILVTVSTEEVGSAAPVTLLVALGFAIFYIGIVGERVLVLANRPRTVTAIYTGLALVNAVLNAVLIPRLGLMGAALATLASFSLYSVAALSIARKHCRFHFPISVLVKSLVAGIAGAVVAFPLAGDGVARIAAAIGGGGLTYGVVLLAVGGVHLRTLTALVREERPTVARQAE
jgi:O-antigen/teichoic acid export membrane protein